MPTCATCVFGSSTEVQQRRERAFYASYSSHHPPKRREGLLEREERFMRELRHERSTKGHSEGFATRRRFPIVSADDDGAKGSESIEDVSPASPPEWKPAG